MEREDDEDDAIPESLADELDANEDARRTLASMATVDPSLYDLRRLHNAVQHDVRLLTEVWEKVKGIDAEHDSKLTKLKELLSGKLKGRKVLTIHVLQGHGAVPLSRARGPGQQNGSGVPKTSRRRKRSANGQRQSGR